MDEPTPTRPRRHRIAAAFDSEADADAALADLRPLAHEVHVDVHLAGCHDVDEAERGLGVTMVRCILVTIPVTILVMLGLGLVFRSALGDQSFTDVLASPTVEHRAEEVLVARIERGALHNPNLRRTEYDGMRTRAVVDHLEDRVRQVFEEHHGRLIDA
jgi:hypothetical protein